MRKVDILLPAYNGEKYIESQISSLLNQTYSNINIYIRDDISTDRTSEIIQSLGIKDSRIVIIENANINLGLVGNLNLLLGISQEDYIMYCDQDDVWLENKVEVLMNEMLQREDEYSEETPLLIHSDCFVTDEHLNIKGIFKGSKPLKYGLNNSLFKYYVQGASTLFNKALKKQIYPFLDEVYLHDRFTHLVAEITGKRFYVNIPLMLYRQHNSNLVGSSSFLQKIKNNLSYSNLSYYIKQDRILIEAIYNKMFVENELLNIYLRITSNKISRISKLRLLVSHKISMRFKEFMILILKN